MAALGGARSGFLGGGWPMGFVAIDCKVISPKICLYLCINHSVGLVGGPLTPSAASTLLANCHHRSKAYPTALMARSCPRSCSNLFSYKISGYFVEASVPHETVRSRRDHHTVTFLMNFGGQIAAIILRWIGLELLQAVLLARLNRKFTQLYQGYFDLRTMAPYWRKH